MHCEVIYGGREVPAVPVLLCSPCVPLLCLRGVCSLERVCRWERERRGFVSQTAALSKAQQKRPAARTAHEMLSSPPLVQFISMLPAISSESSFSEERFLPKGTSALETSRANTQSRPGQSGRLVSAGKRPLLGTASNR